MIPIFSFLSQLFKVPYILPCVLLLLPQRKQTLYFLFVSERQHGCLDFSLTHNKIKAFKVSSGSAKRWGFDVPAFHEYKTWCCDRHKQNKALARNLKVSCEALYSLWIYILNSILFIWSKFFIRKEVLGKRTLLKSYTESLFPSHGVSCKGNYPNDVNYTKPANWPQALKNAIGHKPAKTKR